MSDESKDEKKQPLLVRYGFTSMLKSIWFGRFVLMFVYAVGIIILAGVYAQNKAEEKVDAALHKYVEQVAAPTSPVDQIQLSVEVASLKSEVEKLKEEDKADADEKLEVFATLMITVLTVAATICLALYNMEKMAQLIKYAGKDLAEQTVALLQASNAKSAALLLLSLQFSKNNGWKRKHGNDDIDELIIREGETALRKALQEEEYKKTAIIELDFQKAFPGSGVPAMRNNLLFSYSLMTPSDPQIKSKYLRRIAVLLEEAEKSTDNRKNYLLTELRAELNFFDELNITGKEKGKRYDTLLAKLASVKTLKEERIDLISESSFEYCRGKMQHLASKLGKPAPP